MDVLLVEREGHVPTSIGLLSVDNRVLDRSPLLIRHRQDDKLTDSRELRPIESQRVFRYVHSSVREEDLVVILYFLLASAYGSGREVEAYSPVIVARRRFVVDGRDKEIIEFLEVSSERFKSVFFSSLRRA